jgi:hypothetical protein
MAILAISVLSNGFGEWIANATSTSKGPYSLDMVRYRSGASVERCVGMMEVKEAAGQEEEIDWAAN